MASLRNSATTDGDGRFAVDVSKRGTRTGKGSWLTAKASGFGLDFIALEDRTMAKDVELRLPPDSPIRGRVIDLQGKPVAGALVQLNTVVVYGNDTVEPFLTGLRKRADLRSPEAASTKGMFGGTQSLLFTTTSKDGHFELTGVGVERRVRLRITGPGIAQTYAAVITRAGFDPEPYNALTRALYRRTERQCRGLTNRPCCSARTRPWLPRRTIGPRDRHRSRHGQAAGWRARCDGSKFSRSPTGGHD